MDTTQLTPSQQLQRLKAAVAAVQASGGLLSQLSRAELYALIDALAKLKTQARSLQALLIAHQLHDRGMTSPERFPRPGAGSP